MRKVSTRINLSMPRRLTRIDTFRLLWIFCFKNHYSIPLSPWDEMCRPGSVCADIKTLSYTRHIILEPRLAKYAIMTWMTVIHCRQYCINSSWSSRHVFCMLGGHLSITNLHIKAIFVLCEEHNLNTIYRNSFAGDEQCACVTSTLDEPCSIVVRLLQLKNLNNESIKKFIQQCWTKRRP